jgi:iron-sulfur cluster repair protein YtfE (RIC family)
MEATSRPIDPWMTVRDARVQFPGVEQVFAHYGISFACSDCSVAEAAQRARVPLSELLWALNQAALASQEELE